ncbi:MAG TPA: HAD family phosphatase [Bryobacteraceae bacterium]|nr:HAD family phosphatase [Bryobacteraceae bacterium]
MTRVRPQAVIFDYGNVLSAPQGALEIERMASILEVSRDQFSRAYWQHRVAYDEAALEPAAYWRAVEQILSRRLTEAQIASLIETDNRSWSYPDAVVPRWARDLRENGLKTALLSNMPASVREYVDRCGWLPPFDQRTFSCDVRAAKPRPEIFRHCLAGLGVDAAEILFLDDRPDNVRAAETLGLHAILYRTIEQAARDIDEFFDIPVPLIATVYENNEEDQ